MVSNASTTIAAMGLAQGCSKNACRCRCAAGRSEPSTCELARGVEQDRHLAGGIARPGAAARTRRSGQRVLDQTRRRAAHTVATNRSPVCTLKVAAVSAVDRDLAGAVGCRRTRTRSVGCPYFPSGSSARRSSESGEPGIAIRRWSISSTAPNTRRAAATSLRSGRKRHQLLAGPSSSPRDVAPRCRRDATPDRRRRHREHHQRQRPAPAVATHAGTAATTIGRSRVRRRTCRGRRSLARARSLLERQAHDVALGVSSDSGPGVGIVWSTGSAVAQEHHPVGPRRRLRVVRHHHTRHSRAGTPPG